MLAGVPVVAAIAALLSLRRVQISLLGVSRRATRKRPGLWRLTKRVPTISLPGNPGDLPVSLPLPLPDLQHHLHRVLAELFRVLPLCGHDPASSQGSEPPGFPG
jgi:hypothetical protein